MVATFAETWKNDKYAPVLERSHIPRHTFFTFAIEATGRLGNEAVRFLRLISSKSTINPNKKASCMRFCKRRIRYAVLRANADARAAFLASVEEYHSTTTESTISPITRNTTVEDSQVIT